MRHMALTFGTDSTACLMSHFNQADTFMGMGVALFAEAISGSQNRLARIHANSSSIQTGQTIRSILAISGRYAQVG